MNYQPWDSRFCRFIPAAVVSLQTFSQVLRLTNIVAIGLLRVKYIDNVFHKKIKVSREETGKALKKLGYIQHSKRGHLSSDFPVKGYYVKYHY